MKRKYIVQVVSGIDNLTPENLEFLIRDTIKITYGHEVGVKVRSIEQLED